MYQGANFNIDGAEVLGRSQRAGEKALQINPRSVDALIALEDVYSEEGREGESIRAGRQAVANAPNNAFAWDGLGYAYYYAGLNELAEQAYRRVIELNPTPPRNHWMHARMLLYTGKPAEAEQEMREVVAKNPDQFKALGYLGNVLYYEGKLDEAESVFDRANQLGRDSSDDAARLMAGFLYAARNERGKIDPRLLRYRPDQMVDGDGAYWIGGIYALLGDKQQAVTWLKRTAALGDVNYPWFEKDKNYDGLRTDAEYQAVMAQIHTRWQAYRNEFDPGR